MLRLRPGADLGPEQTSKFQGFYARNRPVCRSLACRGSATRLAVRFGETSLEPYGFLRRPRFWFGLVPRPIFLASSRLVSA